MEIRRIEPELIKPPSASEHGARVENDRRQRQPRQDARQDQDERNASEEEAPSAENAAPEAPPAAGPATYRADGHLNNASSADGDPHTIDYTA